MDDILNINNIYFDNIVRQIYPAELQLNKANTSDAKASFLDLHLTISYDTVLPKFMINATILILNFFFNFPFLDGNVPRSTSYAVDISQFIQFAWASSHVADFNTRNKLLNSETSETRLSVS